MTVLALDSTNARWTVPSVPLRTGEGGCPYIRCPYIRCPYIELLRLKYDSGAGFRTVPEGFDLTEWRDFFSEFEWLGGGSGEKFPKGGAKLIERRAAEAASQQLQPGAAQRRGIQRNRRTGTGTDLDVSDPRR